MLQKKAKKFTMYVLAFAIVCLTVLRGASSPVKGAEDESQETTGEITLALNVYYNDSTIEYYDNEVSTQTVTVTGDGQYTLSFDCATDLSDAAIAAGVESLSNLTAIYIKDYAVTMGESSLSPLDSCDIMYDEVKVNGESLTITQTEPKSAIKISGILDTNDPINGWDGSVVSEVEADSDHAANFTTIENPTTVEVTFTLSNVVFTQEDSESEETESSAATDTNTSDDADSTSADAAEGALPVFVWVIIVVVVVVLVILGAVIAVVAKKKK